MVNNIGSTTLTLSTTIGTTTEATDPIGTSTITMISGQLAVGAIISDADGTVAIVTSYSLNSQNKYVYILKTITTKTEMDVTQILLAEY